MARLRILQVSDLQAGSEEFAEVTAPEQGGSRLVRDLARALGDARERDSIYLVICGNLTADGRPESFRALAGFLNQLPGSVFATSEDWRLRVLVVPGEQDCPQCVTDRCSADAFSEFHDDFYRDYLIPSGGWIRPFTLSQALVSPLKDLTLVGVSFWRYLPRAYELLEMQLASVSGQIADKPYYRRHPSVLAIADSPVLSFPERRRLYRSRVAQLIDSEIQAALHLFGAGEVTWISNEPFVFRQLAVGTGPRPRRSIWPLRLNLIDFPLHYARIAESEATHGTLVFYQMASKDDGWEAQPTDPIASPPSLFKAIPNASPILVHNTFLQELGDILLAQKGGIFLIEGLPGSGAEDPMRFLLGHDERVPVAIPNGQTSSSSLIVRAIYRQIQRSDDKFDAEREQGDFSREIDALFCDLNSKIEETNRTAIEDQRLILVLHDPYYRSGSEESWRDALFPGLKQLAGRVDALLYVVPHWSCSMTYGSYFHGKIHSLQGLREDVLERALEGQPAVAPLSLRSLHSWTGGYVGFTQALVSSAWEAFSTWAGTHPIDGRCGATVIDRATRSQATKRYAQPFLELLQDPPGGNELIALLSAKLLSSSGEHARSQGEELGIVRLLEADLAELCQEDRNAVDELLGILMRFGVAESTGSHSYVLRVPLPFLWYRIYHVFFSFQAADEHFAAEVARALRGLGIPHGMVILPHLFTEELGLLPRHDLWMIQRLRESRNMVVFFRDSRLSDWMAKEYSSWKRSWRDDLQQGRAWVAGVGLRGTTEIPLQLENHNIIGANVGPAEIARWIWRFLKPSYDQGIAQSA